MIFSAPFLYNRMSISSWKPWFFEHFLISWHFESHFSMRIPHSSLFVTKNIDLLAWALFLYSNEENNIIIWHFVRDKCQVPNSDPHGFEYIISNLEFSFFWIMFDDFWWYSYVFFMKIWRVEDEEFPGIHFPGGTSPKAWIWISFRSKNMNPFCAKTNQFLYFRASESLPLGRPTGRL